MVSTTKHMEPVWVQRWPVDRRVFQKHVSKIHSGTFQPLSSTEWRNQLRDTRITGKVTFNMKMGAADFISVNKQFFDSLSTIS